MDRKLDTSISALYHEWVSAVAERLGFVPEGLEAAILPLVRAQLERQRLEVKATLAQVEDEIGALGARGGCTEGKREPRDEPAI
jgi:hypothetical protein